MILPILVRHAWFGLPATGLGEDERKGLWLLFVARTRDFIPWFSSSQSRRRISKLGSPAELELEETASTIFTRLLILCHALGQV